MSEQRPHTANDGVGRRSFLQGAAVAVPLAYAAHAGVAPAAQPAPGPQAASPNPGLILRQFSPDNLEFPFPTLNSFITPTERFYVRSHFPVPALDAKTWRLRIEGAVDKPFDWMKNRAKPRALIEALFTVRRPPVRPHFG